MAHREFLLFLLAMVIVALAVTVGIFAFTEGAAKNTQDMMLSRGVSLASDSQQWVAPPGMYAGGSGSFDGIDIWKVTGQAGSGEWLEEGDVRYGVAPLPGNDRARLVAENLDMDYHVVITFDRETIIETQRQGQGFIYVDGEPG